MDNFDKEEYRVYHYIPIPGGGMIEVRPARIVDVTRDKDGNWTIHTSIGVRHLPPVKEKGVE